MTSPAPHGQRQTAMQPAMQPRRVDPVAGIEQLQDRIGNLLHSFFADPFSAMAIGTAPVWMPPVDIEETDDAYLAEVDLPGVKAEDINLELRDNKEVRITGEYRERERTGTMRRQNRRTGRFEYMVTLPGDVDPKKIDAMLDNGVLTVSLGKAASGQPRRIEVKGGRQGQSRSGHGRQSRGT